MCRTRRWRHWRMWRRSRTRSRGGCSDRATLQPLIIFQIDDSRLPFAAVEDLEVVALVGREEGGYVAEALGEGGGGEEGVVALAEIVVVEVHCEREHVDGQRVGEGGLEEGAASALVDGHLGGFAIEGAAVGSANIRSAHVLSSAAGLPGVLTGFAADLGLGPLPGEGGEAVGDAGGLDKVVGHVDEEFEGQSEAVLDQAGGEKDGLGGCE